jgi:hypothetical protein
MNGWRWLVWVSTVGTLSVSCGGGPPAPGAVGKVALAGTPAEAKPLAAKDSQKPAVPAVKPRLPEAGSPLPPLPYEVKGRRDPFTQVVVAKEKSSLDLSTFKLAGVIRGRQLLALVESAGGLGYILKPGDSLGPGLVTDVTMDSVTFAVGGQAPRGVTLRLAGN